MSKNQKTQLRKRFVSSVKWNLIGQIFNLMIGIVLSAVIARGLGPEDYGIYASVLAVIGMVPFIISLGFETIINVKLPTLMIEERKSASGQIVYFVRSLLINRFLIALVASIVIYFFAEEISIMMKKEHMIDYLRVASFSIVFSNLINLLNVTFKAQLKIKIVQFLGAFQQFTILVLVLIFFKLEFKINGVFYSTILGLFLSLSLYLFFSRALLFKKSEKRSISDFYGIGLTAWAIGFVSFALGKQTDIILLNFFGIPSSKIGFYNVAFVFSIMLSFLGTGLGSIFQSIFSETYGKGGNKELANSWYISAKISFLTWFPIFAFTFIYSQSIVSIIYGSNFVAASGLFRIMVSFKLVYVLLNASYAMPVFYLVNKKRVGLYFRICAGILNLVLDIILIPKYGVSGAVFATGLSTALIGCFEILVVIRSIKAGLPFLFYFKILMIFGLALIPTLIITNDTLLYMILKGIVYGISSVVLMWLIKPIENNDKLFVKSASTPLYKIVKYF